MYRDFPGFFIGDANDPVTPYRRALGNYLCKDRQPGLPPNPTTPFSGGQCVTQYRVDYKIGRTPSTGGQELFATTSAFVFGPLSAPYVAASGSSTDPAWTVYQPGKDGVGNAVQRVVYNVSQSLFYISSLQVLAVVRLDGSADNCGSLPAQYSKLPPPASRQNVTVNVPVPSGFPSLSFPITIPQVTNNVNIGISIPANLTFNFSLGGLSVNTDTDSFSSNDRSLLNTISTNVSIAASNSQSAAINAGSAQTQAVAAKDAANNAIAAANNAKAAADAATSAAQAAKKNTDPPKPVDSPSLNKSQRPSAEKTRDNVPNLVWVVISLTKLPLSSKSMSGGGANNVYFSGWFEWLVNGKPLPREQIQFSPSLFRAPPGATGYAYTLTHGALGFATEYTDSPS